jgi:hypothetical protein
MADVPVARDNIQIEEVDTKSPISESVLFKTAGALNFVNKRQYDQRSFQLNGSYALGVGLQGADQVIPILFDAEIVGYSLWNGGTGTSGQSVFDIHRLTGGDTDAGSIFTIKPQVDSTATDNTYSMYDFANAADINLPTGFTHATLITDGEKLDQGDALRLDIDDAMPGASNAGLYLFMRPR